AALCADYSVPVDCVAAGPAPRPSSFHEISAPKSHDIRYFVKGINMSIGNNDSKFTANDNFEMKYFNSSLTNPEPQQLHLQPLDQRGSNVV
ncbi:hypothetical protein SFRURICE_003473, partial [Spodoptera frugiperda]